jgi:hypothetical protein
MNKATYPVILNVIHHCRKPVDCMDDLITESDIVTPVDILAPEY